MSSGVALTAGFEEEPGTPLRFVDPRFDQAGASDVMVHIAQVVHFAKACRKLLIVFAKLREHGQRLYVFRIVVQHALVTGDMSDRSDRGPTYLTDALRNRVAHCVKLVGLFVQQKMVVAEMRPAYMPMEVFCLDA